MNTARGRQTIHLMNSRNRLTALLMLLSLCIPAHATDYWVLSSFYTKEGAEAEVAELREKTNLDVSISQHRDLFRVVVAAENITDARLMSQYGIRAWRISQVNLLEDLSSEESLMDVNVADSPSRPNARTESGTIEETNTTDNLVTQGAIPAEKPVASGLATDSKASSNAPAQSRAGETFTQTPVPDVSDQSVDKYLTVKPGDTLWQVALEVGSGTGTTVQQMMLALKRANPAAFIDNNLNLLKAGEVLRIPTPQEIREGTLQSAVNEIREDNQAFADYRNELPASATEAANSRPQAMLPAADGELRLLMPEKQGTKSERDDSSLQGRVDTQTNRLALVEEELDSQSRSIPELKSRVSNLEEQVEILFSIVRARDSQIETLGAEITRLQSISATSDPAGTAQAKATSNTLHRTAPLADPFVIAGLIALLVATAAIGIVLGRRAVTAEGDNQEEEEEEEEFTVVNPGIETSMDEESWRANDPRNIDRQRGRTSVTVTDA